MSTEPSPIMDPGPYLSREQAGTQVAAILYGIPDHLTAPGFAGELILMDALHKAGVQVGGWEDVARQEITSKLDPEVIQVIAGWLIRARLADLDRGQRS